MILLIWSISRQDGYGSLKNVSELTELLLSVNAFPIIYHPTRVTKTSSTLIDNIFTNSFSQCGKVELLNVICLTIT